VRLLEVERQNRDAAVAVLTGDHQRRSICRCNQRLPPAWDVKSRGARNIEIAQIDETENRILSVPVGHSRTADGSGGSVRTAIRWIHDEQVAARQQRREVVVKD